MSPSPSRGNTNWPAATAHPNKRRRVAPRQIIADSAEVIAAEETCEDSGNQIISCFPTTGTVIPQEEWATFVCMSFQFHVSAIVDNVLQIKCREFS
jgi:hypothetical protein